MMVCPDRPDDSPGRASPTPDPAPTQAPTRRPTRTSAMVDDMRRRQRDGELSADLDPPYALQEFLEAYAEQLRRVIARLAPPP